MSCNKPLSDNPYDVCCRPALHDGPCARFSVATRLETMAAMMRANGVPEDEIEQTLREHMGWIGKFELRTREGIGS